MSANREPVPGSSVGSGTGGFLHPQALFQMQSLQTLIEQHEIAMQSNADNLQIHEKFKDDYVVLRNHLKGMADKLEYEALVPLGPKVLAYGKVIHTNEITCLLGDNWFVECTAKKATQIVNRRIQKCDEMLKQLKKEAELFSSWKSEAEQQLQLAVEEGAGEIVEEYDEEAEKRWKQQHREKVRKHHQELAKQRKETAEADASLAEEEAIWKRLDELELEESKSRRKSVKFAPSPSSSKVENSIVEVPSPHPKVLHQTTTTKNSILKTTENPTPITSAPINPSGTSLRSPAPTTSAQNKPSETLRFPVNIIERSEEYSVPTDLNQPEKRVSKFKRSRQIE